MPIVTTTGRFNARVVDVNARGARLECTIPIQTGHLFHLCIDNAEVPARVVDARPGTLGVRFERLLCDYELSFLRNDGP